ncbi:tautomerase family protein (plasmid) [Agrobacterium sp. rho-13.3]|uniref:tautomerase family protein n=1 Tax=Agrobacterium sp. rho-13.3 TaxID=3072980 RepID=UPI002A120F5F|nr:tautomerase family protein [Agrobacterium sp. rho-13.3]MDX8310278.1 tautomerase family protein [Agrobacterium sp. rho-13.3]
MPIVKIELFSGRDESLKAEIAVKIAALLEEKLKISQKDTTVIFTDVPRGDWFVAGQSNARE